MVLKFVEVAMLNSCDEAEAIAILNDFLSRFVKHQYPLHIPVHLFQLVICCASITVLSVRLYIKLKLKVTINHELNKIFIFLCVHAQRGVE